MAPTLIVGLHCSQCGRERDWRARASGRDICHRCKAHPVKGRLRTQQVFHPHFGSVAKRWIQRDLYSSLATRVASLPRVLIVPGRAPDHEVNCIRNRMPKAHITAFDRDPKAIHAAAQVGVERAICGDLRNIDVRTAPECLNYEEFNVVNIDLCSNIPGTNRWHAPAAWCDSILNKTARRARQFFVAFVLYGHDEFDYLQRPREEIRRFVARTRVSFPEVPPVVELRLQALWSQVWEQGFTPVRVYIYQNRTQPMVAAVFARNGARWTPFVSTPPTN